MENLDRESFAAALKMHQDRLGLTQAEAAGLLGVSPRVLWQWREAKGNPLAVTMEGALARLKFWGGR
jgi:transcriptional regulator with XRE-family HTH domain